MSKSFLQIIKSCFVQKSAPKNTKYSRNESILKIGHHAKALQNAHFGSKIKIPKNMSKSFLQIIKSCFVQKSAPKNAKYSRNESILKIGHHAKAIGHAKCSVWVKNKNSKKHVKIHSTNHFEIFCAKNRSKKHQIFEKWEHFENRPSCKAYRLCKMLTLSKKLIFQKTCQNLFYKSFRVALCKKTTP